jgi:hypothetical protein
VVRFFILAFSIVIYSVAFAQESRDYNWQLGLFSNSSTHPEAQSIEMKFGDSGILIDTFFRVAGFYFFNASISGENGNLLLYSNGCNIRDSNHKMLASTSHLNHGDVDIEWCNGNYGYPISDGGFFLPFLGDSILVLIHQRMITESNPTQVISDSLFYTSVKLEDGEYSLLEKSIPIVGGHLTNGNVEAVKASKPGAWWIMQSKKRSNQYLSILLDSAKVNTIISYFIGDTAIDGSAAGQSSFSPDDSKYARYAPRDDLFFFDFDRG